ncbi:FAD-dependent monooxygenase [Streptomyces oryzae]|uniref:FAD-dependent monooxygenase n=1 Tax=Streptomyces oryzae TaxID=1434886 RepID=A0ABS3XBU8_9ACTN|nr:FAD-dependent monooxygenase [Streptomyces oryzae]MBO8192576.1 FAD-dependent monooxygenase [Streptomyces oryzae]
MDPVIIVGAGPVGLALSLALARHAVPSLVLDSTDGNPPPRAARTCVLRPDTAAVLPALPGLRWRSWRTQRRTQLVDQVDIAPDQAPVHVEQHALERTLRSALADQKLARIVTGSHVDLLEQDTDGVTVHTRGPSGTWWRGSYAVGCDGARSMVRKLLGVRFPGRTAVERHAVAALRVQLPWEEGEYDEEGAWEPGDVGSALLHRDPGGTPGEVTARPLAGGRWRLDWLLPPRGDLVTPEEMLERVADTLAVWSEESLKSATAARTTAIAAAAAPVRRKAAGVGWRETGTGTEDAGASGGIGPYELVDTGVHTVHQRLARHWRVNRAFLAGDAAHLTGALGVQSVDEGLRDAANLAWKLALAWHHGHGPAADTLLDSYETERRGAMAARLRAVDQALPVVRGGGGLRALLPGGGTRTHLGLLTDGHLGRGLLGAPPAYARTPLTPPRGSIGEVPVGTAPGAPVCDVPVTATDGSRGNLHDWLGGPGGELLVMLVAPGTGVWDSRHWLTAGMMPELAASVEALPLRATLLVAESYPGAAAHTVLAVRADGHLAAAFPAGRPNALRSCAERVRGGAHG